MVTIKDVFEDYKQLNKIYNAQETEAITLLAISEISKLSKATLKAFPERELSDEQSVTLKRMLTRLQTGEPLQYIVGHTEFYGLPFLVNPSVLIPRPETEELVEWIITSLSERQKIKGKGFAEGLLDIGTGSGCIAISLKKNLPEVKVSAIDISEGALQTAKENAGLNRVDVNFIKTDILNADSGNGFPQYGIIVSNPPYVTLEDKKLMHANVTGFEPHTALFVPEHDPLVFYKAIASFALLHLLPGGLLFFEINESYGHETLALLNTNGFKNTELRKDLTGRDRMVRAEIR